MRDKTASRTSGQKRNSTITLEGLLPGLYLPLYTMVSFTRIPYAEAARRATSPGLHRLRESGPS
jgi:kynurenine 3-monooxygenase